MRRGGSWMSAEEGSLRAARRDSVDPSFRFEHIGFRIVCNES
ncbi:MAG: hypothetical protein SNJ58_07160 [Aggregatilineales bacterium]